MAPKKYKKTKNRSTNRAFVVDMLEPFLTDEWRTTKQSIEWLCNNCTHPRAIPTSRELGICLSRHPSIISRGKGLKEWKWVA
mgnify:CR=1 FL=1